MNKYILLVILGLTIQTITVAQTWDEWFKQTETQKKYLVKQISALKIYAGYVGKGIKLTNYGLNIINGIKHGDFNLHANFYTSLGLVNEGTKKHGAHISVNETYGKIIALQKQARSKEIVDQLNSDEFTYIKKVFSALVTGATVNVVHMRLMLSDNNLELKEDERITRIEKIGADMEDKYLFARHFILQVRLLAQSRVRQKADSKWMSMMYNLK